MKEQKMFRKKCTFCGDTNHSAETYFKSIRQENEKSRAAGDSENRRMKRTPQKNFRFGSGDHLIAKCPKPPK